MNKEDIQWVKMIEAFCGEPEIKKCQTYQEVYKEIEEFLSHKYPNSSAEKIQEVSDDITESICLRMNIPQK